MTDVVMHASLLHGWLPILIQGLSALALCLAVMTRSWQWQLRRLPVALAVGTAGAGALYWYITSLGIAGDPAPLRLWLWTALCGSAVVIVILGWRGSRWTLRGVSLLAIPMCGLSALLMMNLWVGYFPTPYVAWNKFTVGKVPDEVDRWSVTAMQLKGIRPPRGVVVPVSISNRESSFSHRAELVYLPPAWFASNPVMQGEARSNPLGKRLFEQGDPARQVLACASCHDTSRYWIDTRSKPNLRTNSVSQSSIAFGTIERARNPPSLAAKDSFSSNVRAATTSGVTSTGCDGRLVGLRT